MNIMPSVLAWQFAGKITIFVLISDRFALHDVRSFFFTVYGQLFYRKSRSDRQLQAGGSECCSIDAFKKLEFILLFEKILNLSMRNTSFQSWNYVADLKCYREKVSFSLCFRLNTRFWFVFSSIRYCRSKTIVLHILRAWLRRNSFDFNFLNFFFFFRQDLCHLNPSPYCDHSMSKRTIYSVCHDRELTIITRVLSSSLTVSGSVPPKYVYKCKL